MKKERSHIHGTELLVNGTCELVNGTCAMVSIIFLYNPIKRRYNNMVKNDNYWERWLLHFPDDQLSKVPRTFFTSILIYKKATGIFLFWCSAIESPSLFLYFDA